MYRKQDYRALVAALLALAAAVLLPSAAWAQGLGYGSGSDDITSYNDVCIPTNITINWDDGIHIVWDDGTAITQLSYPELVTRVTWDDDIFANWDDGTHIVVFNPCGPPEPTTVLVWDPGHPLITWDDGTIISSIGGYVPPYSH